LKPQLRLGEPTQELHESISSEIPWLELEYSGSPDKSPRDHTVELEGLKRLLDA